jgi:hypothetical protein
MKRVMFFAYGVAAYLIFLATFVYAFAFVGGFAVPRTLDGPLEGPLLTEPNGTYKVTFTNAPAGDYKFYCLPHLALGMHGKITVQ